MSMRKLTLFLILGVLALALVNPYTIRLNQTSLDYLQAVQAVMEEDHPIPTLGESNHPRAAYWNALAALRNGDYTTAARRAEPLAEKGDSMALQVSAWAYEQSGEYTHAIALWLENENLEALLRIAEKVTQAGDLESARQAYAAAQRLNPKEATTPMARFLVEELGDTQAAQDLLQKALDENPLSSARPYWLLLLAGLQSDDGQWAEAAQSYQLAIESAYLMVPGERKLPRYYIEMAWALYQDAQIEPALQALDQALAMEDFELSAAYLLRAAQIYEAAGEIDKAIRAYQRVLELKPDEESAQKALQRLRGNPENK